MAVDVQWQDGRGNVLRSYGGPPLTWGVLSRAPQGGTCVRFIDPVGDTTFNQQQIDALAEELEAWASNDAEPAIRHLLNFVRETQGHVHTYVKFLGARPSNRCDGHSIPYYAPTPPAGNVIADLDEGDA